MPNSSKATMSPAGTTTTTIGSIRNNRNVLLLTCILGIYSCYMMYAYYQEKITSSSFSFPIFLMFGQCISNSLVAYLILCFNGSEPVSPRHKAVAAMKYMSLAATYNGGMLASYSALSYVTYPIMTLGKSCKMLPVMLVGMLFYNKRYQLKNYICMVCLAVGIASFFLLRADKKGNGNEALMMDATKTMIGMGLVLASLTFDGLTGAQQDQWTRPAPSSSATTPSSAPIKPPSTHQLMFGMNKYAAIQLFGASIVTGQLQSGITFCTSNTQVTQDLFIFFVIGALGQNFIFLTVKEFGAVALSIITTTRKFFTILLSVIIFGHSLSVGQWIATIIVFAALGWDIQIRSSK